jgi:DNA-binding CsgD family transcriptional regulator
MRPLPTTEEANPGTKSGAVIADEELPSGYQKRVGDSEPPGSGKRHRRSWENVEEFNHQGYCYRLQRRPIEETQDTPLAPREEEALDLAATGLSRKEIAENLGLAPSTVGVLLHRAAVKLGARSRRELIQSYRSRQNAPSDSK